MSVNSKEIQCLGIQHSLEDFVADLGITHSLMLNTSLFFSLCISVDFKEFISIILMEVSRLCNLQICLIQDSDTEICLRSARV